MMNKDFEDIVKDKVDFDCDYKHIKDRINTEKYLNKRKTIVKGRYKYILSYRLIPLFIVMISVGILLHKNFFQKLKPNNILTSEVTTEETTTNDENDRPIFIIPANYDFEEVIKYSDDIFIGKLIGVRQGYNLSDSIPNEKPLTVTSYIEYEFEVTDVVYSGYDRNPETIKVYFHDYGVIENELGYNPMYDCTFYEGYEYLLPVQITDNAYYKHDVYHIAGDMVLSLDQEIAQYSSLMGVHSIITKEGDDLAKDVSKEALISYVNRLLENKEKNESYTGETDILKIADFSKNIYKVKVKELVQTRQNEVVFGEVYTVEILEVVKEEYHYESEVYKITFIGGTVKPGDVVYVGLDFGGPRYKQTGVFFDLTSKIFFTSDDINRIRQHIEN